MSQFPIRAAVIVCEDCGRTRVWSAEDAGKLVDSVSGKPRKRLFCQKCRERGGEGYNVSVEVKRGEALALATHHDPMNRLYA